MKMGLVALVGVCVVFYQYHLSTGVRFEQVTDFSTAEGSVAYAPGNLQPPEALVEAIGRKITEETVSNERKMNGSLKKYFNESQPRVPHWTTWC